MEMVWVVLSFWASLEPLIDLLGYSSKYSWESPSYPLILTICYSNHIYILVESTNYLPKAINNDFPSEELPGITIKELPNSTIDTWDSLNVWQESIIDLMKQTIDQPASVTLESKTDDDLTTIINHRPYIKNKSISQKHTDSCYVKVWFKEVWTRVSMPSS